MAKVDSSNVVSYEYDRKAKELKIEFVGGRKYLYPKVSPQRVSAFVRSDSPGKYVNDKLKGLKSEKI